MHTARHEQPYGLEYIPDDLGLEEFDRESADTKRPRRPVGALPGAEELRVFTVIEQYGSSAPEPGELAIVSVPAATGRSLRGRPALRLLGRLACAAALVAIPGRSLVTSKPPPVYAAPTAIAMTATAQVFAAALAASPPVLAAPRRDSQQLRRRAEPVVTTAPVPPARTRSASPQELAALRQVFSGLDGPFMTFEHCDVRLASADRAIARCLGTRSDADRTSASPAQRRIEWTLGFDRAAQRWSIVDATAR